MCYVFVVVINCLMLFFFFKENKIDKLSRVSFIYSNNNNRRSREFNLENLTFVQELFESHRFVVEDETP
jgi:hypothetical protein